MADENGLSGDALGETNRGGEVPDARARGETAALGATTAHNQAAALGGTTAHNQAAAVGGTAAQGDEPDTGPEWRSDMADVSGLSLADLIELTDGQNSTLALSLRRLAEDLADPGEPIAGFNSAL